MAYRDSAHLCDVTEARRDARYRELARFLFARTSSCLIDNLNRLRLHYTLPAPLFPAAFLARGLTTS